MTLGEKIYEYRTNKNLSQGDLAEMLEVSRQSVSKWENDGAIPDLDKIIKLAEIFGITIDELVKGENIPKQAEPAPMQTAAAEKSVFPPRMIAGTVLLSLSFIVTVIFLAAGGGISGLVLSSPLILCGIVCFIFKKNVGLWCSWAAFFAIDMYLRFATGLNWGAVFNTFIWTYDMNYARLAIAWVQFIVLLVLIATTVLWFRKIPLENKKAPIIFWAVFGIMRLGLIVFSNTHFYKEMVRNLLATANTWIYSLCYSIYDWLCAGIFAAALVLSVRYLVSRRERRPRRSEKTDR